MIESRRCSNMFEVDEWLKRMAGMYRIIHFQIIPEGSRILVFVLIERAKIDEELLT